MNNWLDCAINKLDIHTSQSFNNLYSLFVCANASYIFVEECKGVNKSSILNLDQDTGFETQCLICHFMKKKENLKSEKLGLYSQLAMQI